MASNVARPRRTQEERKAESERRILRAATELFAEQGYLGTTLNEVGARAGYTGALVSHRYGSKARLLSAVLVHISAGFEARAAELFDPEDVRGSFARYARLYVEGVARNPSIRALYVVMGEALGGLDEAQDDVAALNRRTRAGIVHMLEAGIGSGELPEEMDARATAVLILALLRGTTLQFLAEPRLRSARQLAMQVAAALDRLLR